MNKIINFGSVNLGYKKANSEVYCRIEIKDGRLLITGVIGPRKGGNADGGCGQIDTEFKHRDQTNNGYQFTADNIKFASGWDKESFLDFLDIWDKWHQNDMRSACEHQRKLGWTFQTHKGQKCPECGYLIGSAWLKEELPAEVIKRLESFPESKKTPAWC